MRAGCSGHSGQRKELSNEDLYHPAEGTTTWTQGGHPYQDGQPDYRSTSRHANSWSHDQEDRLTCAEAATWLHAWGPWAAYFSQGRMESRGQSPKPGVELQGAGTLPILKAQ